MPRDKDVVAVASATSTGLLERAGPTPQAVSGATIPRAESLLVVPQGFRHFRAAGAADTVRPTS
jgi:hypothetical protein